MRTHCQTIDTRWGSYNHPTILRNTSLILESLLGWTTPSQTTHEQGAYFSTPISLFSGFRLTHQPSPWIGDHAWCLITPITGEIASSTLLLKQLSDERSFVFWPHYLRFFRTLSDSTVSWFQAVAGCHALWAPEKFDSLLFMQQRELEGLDPYRPNLPLPYSDQAHRRYFLLFFYLQW